MPGETVKLTSVTIPVSFNPNVASIYLYLLHNRTELYASVSNCAAVYTHLSF